MNTLCCNGKQTAKFLLTSFEGTEGERGEREREGGGGGISCLCVKSEEHLFT